MDLHCEMILEQYKQKKPLFIKIKDIALQELNKYVKEFGTIVNSVEGRVKEEKSLAGKLELKGYKYQSIDDITDIVGTRVVTFYNDEVDIVKDIVYKTMVDVFKLSVPLDVDIETGNNWYEAK